MSAEKRERIRESDLSGLKSLDRLMPLLERLRPVGCARDRAGNRQLFFDGYCALVLLYLFNPIVSSLRALVQASELKKVQRKLGCSRASLGSLSEAARVFDPELLREIVGELVEQVPSLSRDARLNDLAHELTAVDGSILAALPQITQASFLQKKRGPAADGWRLHTRFGGHVATAGDVDNDGRSDVIVGARGYDNGVLSEGAALLYHGSATTISTTQPDVCDVPTP